jgi:transposase-like protein
VDLTRHGCGVRDIVRVLGVSSATVIHTLKKGHRPPTGQQAKAPNVGLEACQRAGAS